MTAAVADLSLHELNGISRRWAGLVPRVGFGLAYVRPNLGHRKLRPD